jgi:hypothetical protein
MTLDQKIQICIAIGTLAVATVAAFQMVLFVWQLRLMRKSVNDAATAGSAAQNSAKVAMDTFTKLERPWIFLDRFRVIRREGAPIQPQLLNNFYISLIFKNVGRSPAFISDLVFKFIETPALPPVPDWSLCESNLGVPATVAAGEEFESTQVGPAPGQDVEYTMIGLLTYRDMAATDHHTGFALNVSPNVPAASANENRRYDFHD